MKLKSIFFPNKILGFIIFNLGMGLLFYVFMRHLEGTPLAYFSYFLSAYALVIFIFWFYKTCKFGHSIVKKSKLYNKYQTNLNSITKIFLSLSLLINLVYGMFKLVAGIYYKSEWFITFAVYYLLLSFVKLYLVLALRKDRKYIIEDGYRKLKHTGIVLLLLDIVLFGMIILIVSQNQVIIYPGYLIYIVALYDFWLIICAFINVFKYRKQNNPVLVAIKCVNLTVAMISIISLEVAMIYQFDENDGNFKMIMTVCTGMGVCLINSFMSIYMIYKSTKRLKK